MSKGASPARTAETQQEEPDESFSSESWLRVWYCNTAKHTLMVAGECKNARLVLLGYIRWVILELWEIRLSVTSKADSFKTSWMGEIGGNLKLNKLDKLWHAESGTTKYPEKWCIGESSLKYFFFYFRGSASKLLIINHPLLLIIFSYAWTNSVSLMSPIWGDVYSI